jgi:3,4-dihydroxy 2-butanone 4-phosphate synthase/GTP cyclohydrolase II
MVHFASISDAINELRQGRMIILVDDDDREGEGDLVVAAEYATPAAINFMLKYARGIVCLTVTDELVKRLQLPLMAERLKHPNQALFTTSIEAARGVTSGVSVYDRAHTIRVAIDSNSTPNDIAMPGHIFPIQARPGGVLERCGHTEGSVDLVRLANLIPAAVICEIMQDDGSMARLPELTAFAKLHQIKMAAINDLVAYRLECEYA